MSREDDMMSGVGVSRIQWRSGAPPAQDYDFVLADHPDYVLVGGFARWVGLYPAKMLAADYRLVTRIGGYELYSLNQ